MTAARQSESRSSFQAVSGASDFPTPFFRVGKDRCLVDVNRAGVRLLGYPDLKTLVDTPIEELIAERDGAARFVEAVNETGSVAGFELELRHRTGRKMWVEISARAVPPEATSPYTIEGTAVDITKHKRSQASLGIVQRQLDSFFYRSPIAHWVEDFSALMPWLDRLRGAGVEDLRSYLDQNPDEVRFGMELIRIVDVNPAGLKLIGAVDKEEVLERGFGFTTGEESLDSFKAQIVAAWEGQTSFRTLGAGRSADGRLLEYILTWVVVVNGEPDLGTVVVSIEDITELSAAQRRLVHLAEMKDKFIASITHELRTPLTGVLGFAELLRERSNGDLPQEAAEYTDMLVGAASAGGAILDNLLLAAELEDGGTGFSQPIHLVATTVDLTDAADTVISSLPPDARDQVSIAGDRIAADADTKRVRQIIRNLICNAIDHGGDTIELHTHNEDDHVHLAIVDDGPGLPQGAIDRAFRLYESHHVDPGLTRSLGVGLTVSRALARAMGGDLRYERNGVYTKFTLLLPAARGDAK